MNSCLCWCARHIEYIYRSVVNMMPKVTTRIKSEENDI